MFDSLVYFLIVTDLDY